MMIRLLSLTLMCSPFFLFAQTGPGGVGRSDGSSALQFWYSADHENYADGALVNQVADRSGRGFTLTAAGSEQPRYDVNPAGLNGQPTFVFDGNDELEASLVGNSNENMSFIIVLRRQQTGELDVALQHGGRNTIGIGQDGRYRNYVGGADNFGTVAPLNTWIVHSVTFANAGTDRLRFYENSENVATGTHNIENRTTNTWIGGNGTGGATDFNGEIAEVMKFTKVVNQAERIITENHLAAKYGIALNRNEVYRQDEVANGNYDHDVAGIGRVTAAAVHLDARGAGSVRMLNATNLEDDEFFTWGHDGQPEQFVGSGDVPPGVQTRLSRTWRVSELSRAGLPVDVGAIDMRWDLSGQQDPIPADDLRLLVDTDNDGSFADETPIAGAVALGNETFEFAAQTALEDGRRFTLAVAGAGLPIELVHFRVSSPSTTGRVSIGWQTLHEDNNAYFTLERSVDQLSWQDIRRIPGAGNSSAPLTYRTYDDPPTNQRTYYRLKQTDYDGTYAYSDIRSAGPRSPAAGKVYPNPVTHTLTVTAPAGTKSGGRPRIYDLRGREVAVGRQWLSTDDGQGRRLDVGHLRPGMYVVVTEHSRLSFIKK